MILFIESCFGTVLAGMHLQSAKEIARSSVKCTELSFYFLEPAGELSINTPLTGWIVTMVMTSSKKELVMAKHVLPGHIGMSRDLQHLLGIKDLSLVKVQSVSCGPSNIKGIILHPFEDTDQKVHYLKHLNI